MKFRVEFNDGKTFSHYALVVLKVGFVITYIASGLLMFSVLFINAKNYIQEHGFLGEILKMYLG